jgi:hypothetical protein
MAQIINIHNYVNLHQKACENATFELRPTDEQTPDLVF